MAIFRRIGTALLAPARFFIERGKSIASLSRG